MMDELTTSFVERQPFMDEWILNLLSMLHADLCQHLSPLELDSPMIDLDDYHTDVIMMGGQRVGIIQSSDADSFKNAVTIDAVVVLPRWRGRGIGRKAIELFVDGLKERGVEHVNLVVDVMNPAKMLYADLGFEAKSLYMSKELN